MLFPQLVTTDYDTEEREGKSKPHRTHSTAAKKSENTGHLQEENKRAMSNAVECKQAVYAIIEAIIEETEDVDNPLLEKQDRDQKREQEQSEAGEESKYEDPEEIIILDKLITALKKKGRKFDKRYQDLQKKAHTRTELRAGRKKGEVTQGKRSPGNEKAKLSNEESNTEHKNRHEAERRRKEITGQQRR